MVTVKASARKKERKGGKKRMVGHLYLLTYHCPLMDIGLVPLRARFSAIHKHFTISQSIDTHDKKVDSITLSFT